MGLQVIPVDGIRRGIDDRFEMQFLKSFQSPKYICYIGVYKV